MISSARHKKIPFFLFLTGVGILCAQSGCQSLPRSGFDPSGQRLFESSLLTSCPLTDCTLFRRPANTSPAIVNSTPLPGDNLPQNIHFPATPVFPAPFSPASPVSAPSNVLPGSLGASRTNLAAPTQGSAMSVLPPGTHTLTTPLAHSPNTPPQPLFASTGGYAVPNTPVTGPALIMTPHEQIAPIGSEVILVASRLGNRDRLVTNEKIEWALEGAGLIEKIDTGLCRDILRLDCVKARKISGNYAITKTSSVYQTLDRGTIDTLDDIHLLRGQTWVSVNSMREGTSYVSAFAPNMPEHSRRTDVGIIHWVDAQWVLPRLAIAPVGESRILTTTVLHATNGLPREGWIVRYEIISGPDAGLGGSATRIEEVQTDSSGQATTVLQPRSRTAGTSTIGIQIIRPAGLEGDRRITVGSETVRQTWSGNPTVLMNIRGPNEARLGQELHYEITAENRTTSILQGVIALPIPPLAAYIRSEPAGTLQGSTMHWNMELLPNSSARISVVLRQDTPGSLWLRPEFRRTNQVISTPAPPVSQRQEAAVFPGIPAATIPSAPIPASPIPAAPIPSAPIPASPIPSAPIPSAPIPAVRPPVVDPPSSATVYTPATPTTPPAERPALSIKIGNHPLTPVMLDRSFLLQIDVANTGRVDARNVVVLVPLPAEFRGQTIRAGWEQLAADGTKEEPRPSDWEQKIDESNHQTLLHIPVLSSGKTAQFFIEYPRIGAQGFDISCTVHADGILAGQENRRITPP